MSGATEFETFQREMDGWLADLSQKPATFAEADRFYTFGSTSKEAAELLCDERAQASKSAVQHTPGPWIVKSLSMGELNVLSGDMTVEIATLGSPPEAHDRANARLIAAAPDLLAALREARSMIGAVDLEDAGDDYLASWKRGIATVDASIAKAEGRS